MKRTLALILSLAAAAPLLAIDIGLDAEAGWSQGARLHVDMKAGLTFLESFYAKVDVDAGATLDPSVPGAPAAMDGAARLTGEWFSDTLIVGARAGVEGRALAGSPPSFPILAGAFVDATLPVIGDLAAVEARAAVDGNRDGLGAEVHLVSSVCVPLSHPLVVSVDAWLAFQEGTYRWVSFTGLSTLGVKPSVLLALDGGTSLELSGGWAFDVSGGSFHAGPFGALKVGFSFDTLGS
jgi:hypothetical protein